jgi:hypothetical protein
LGRAVGAFGAARLVLLGFGVGPVMTVAVVVALLLTAWDLYQLGFLRRMSFPAPVAALVMQCAKVILGVVVSALATVLFINT